MNFLRESHNPTKSRLCKYLMDHLFQTIPKREQESLQWYLRECDPRFIRLKDWKKWMKGGRVSPYCLLTSIIILKYPRVFQFIETHYANLKGRFNEHMLEALAKIDGPKTVALAQSLFPIALPEDKLYLSVFLYTRGHRDHALFISRFVKEAQYDREKEKRLSGFAEGLINKALIPLADADETLKEAIKNFMGTRHLFYNFYGLISHWWPEEANAIIRETPIPRKFEEGIPLLRVCEKMPPPQRKKCC